MSHDIDGAKRGERDAIVFTMRKILYTHQHHPKGIDQSQMDYMMEVIRRIAYMGESPNQAFKWDKTKRERPSLTANEKGVRTELAVFVGALMDEGETWENACQSVADEHDSTFDITANSYATYYSKK